MIIIPNPPKLTVEVLNFENVYNSVLLLYTNLWNLADYFIGLIFALFKNILYIYSNYIVCSNSKHNKNLIL